MWLDGLDPMSSLQWFRSLLGPGLQNQTDRQMKRWTNVLHCTETSRPVAPSNPQACCVTRGWNLQHLPLQARRPRG